MRIGLAGPIQVRDFLPYLDDRARSYKEWGLGGAQVTQLGCELARRDHPLVIATLDPRATEEVVLEGENLRICIGPYRRRIRSRMLDVFAVERRHLRRTLQRESPDVVHAHWTYEYPLGALATTLPTLTTIRDWAPTILRNTPPWPYRLLRLMMALYVFWRGEHFTANSPYIASKMKSWFGWDIPVIPNALSDDQFYDSPRSPSLEAPVFVSVNNGFGPRKNVRTLLRAFQQLRDACSPACLKLIGTAYGRGEEAHAWATAHDLDDNVEFRGRVPHSTVIETILQADVLVHPAREESFGNTLVEAMAQKTPVIAGRNSGAVPWVLGEGDAGVLTDVEVPSTLAAAMKKMIESEDTWTTYAQAGFERARQNFRLTVTTDQFLSLYTQLANE